LTTSICVSSLAVVFSAPVIGTIADALASKKRILLFATILCVGCTALLSQVGKGAYVLGMLLLALSNFAYGTAEDLVAAFLPELAAREDMGKVSAFGWTIGYVPVTMIITAAFYGLGALPTFLVLKERSKPDPALQKGDMIKVGFERLRRTFLHATHYQDLFRFLISLLVFSCGTSTVISLASVYAQQVMGFTENDSLLMIFAVNVTAAIGAFGIGFIQDRIGSIRTLVIALCLWIVATAGAFFCKDRHTFWILANMIGLALGASGSSGRALVGLFSPPGRSGEFFGLWGLAGKLAAAIGPLTYGIVTRLHFLLWA
jgi:UMF1 family MFS transporter